MANSLLKVDDISETHEFFDTDVARLLDRLTDIENQVRDHQVPSDAGLLNELTYAIHRALGACERLEVELAADPTALEAAKRRFRDAIQSWFDQSWFMERAKRKPRGYAGDFETLIAIYDGRIRSTGMGGYLDAYFLNTDLARAVCARLEAVHEYLCRNLKPGLRVLNVACGPGREYDEQFLEACPGIELTCIDTDEDALNCSASRFQGVPEEQVQLRMVKHSALRMTSAAHNEKLFGNPDLIYSVGLCDYIPDRFLIKILAGWRQMLSEGGITYVAFKDGLRYRPAEYQWLVDWNFYQRTEFECRELMLKAGFDEEQMVMTRDATGIILNFIATRPAAVRLVDEIENAPPHRSEFATEIG
jgi:hypothetical protein